MKKDSAFISSLLVLLVMILTSGCVEKGGNLTEPTTHAVAIGKYHPSNIKLFMSVDEGDFIRFYFMLETANGENIPADGHVKIVIFDDLNNSLYYDEFDVEASDFVDYGFVITGQYIGKAYEWRVSKTDIKKGISSMGLGRALLTFTTLAGKELHAEDTLVKIPTYTEEEIKQMAEEEYEKNAVLVDQKISKGNFEVSVIKAGFFSLYEWGKERRYFRVDMEVKNIGEESEYFSPSGMVIVDEEGNQYENTFGGTLDTFVKIYPTVVKKGYVLFEPPPETVSSVKLIFELGYDEDFKPYVFEFDINLESPKLSMSEEDQTRSGSYEGSFNVINC